MHLSLHLPLPGSPGVGVWNQSFPSPSLCPSQGTHKAVGQGLVVSQGVSTPWWAITHYLWGPLLLRDPLVFSLEPQGIQYPCVANGEAHQES